MKAFNGKSETEEKCTFLSVIKKTGPPIGEPVCVHNLKIKDTSYGKAGCDGDNHTDNHPDKVFFYPTYSYFKGVYLIGSLCRLFLPSQNCTPFLDYRINISQTKAIGSVFLQFHRDC